jgi:hypothetical protein
MRISDPFSQKGVAILGRFVNRFTQYLVRPPLPSEDTEHPRAGLPELTGNPKNTPNFRGFCVEN